MTDIAYDFDRSYELEDRYRRSAGRVYLSGVQALVRLPMLQRERDIAAGLDTRGFISGYRGSPLGTYDMALWQAQDLLEQRGIRFEPGVNEDLAATAVWGSQQAGLYPGARHDGVFGIWYGKGPGVDRSCDALKHANYAGTAPYGGVLALAGDDPGAKSSSIAHQSEQALIHCGIPILNPSNVQDYLDLGLYGFALSRYSGCWVGFKCLTDTVESAGSVEVGPERVRIVEPADFVRPAGLHIAWSNLPVQVERRLFEQRLPAVQAFARANRLDRVIFAGSPRRRLGIVTTGKAYLDVRQALDELGIDARHRRRCGSRDLQGRTHLAARARGHPRVRARPRAPDRDRGEAARDRGAARASALQRRRAPSARGQARRRRTALCAERGRAHARRRRGAAAGLALAHGARARAAAHAARTAARSRRAGRADAAAGVLLGLPAQHLDRGARGQPRAGRDRLSRHGGVAARPPHPRGHPHGRRRRQLDRFGALHRRRVTSSRTSETAPTSTAACSRSAPPSPRT